MNWYKAACYGWPMQQMNSVNRKSNNFDFIRFVVASFVIITHMQALMGLGGNDLLSHLSRGTLQFSHLGVVIFFTISGYLIAQSLAKSEYGMFFLSGSLLYLYHDKIKYEFKWFALAVLLMAGSLFISPSLGRLSHFIGIPYVVFYLSFLPGMLNRWGKYGDFSYGIFIYAIQSSKHLFVF